MPQFNGERQGIDGKNVSKTKTLYEDEDFKVIEKDLGYVDRFRIIKISGLIKKMRDKRDKQIITRKDETCFGCEKELPKGTYAYLFDNEIWCYKCIRGKQEKITNEEKSYETK